MLISRSTIRPPTMTMAKGRCESEPMPCEMAARQQAQCGHQHRHHDGPQPQHRAFDGGVLDGVAARAQLVDVLQHDHAGLHRHAEQRQESDAGRDAEVRAGEQQRQQAAEGRHGDVGQDEQRPLEGVEHV